MTGEAHDGNRALKRVGDKCARTGVHRGGHAIIVVIAIAIASMAAAIVTPTLGQTRQPDLKLGVRLVEARCLACHSKSSLPKVVERCTQTHGEAYLKEFLTRHHAPDDEARRDWRGTERREIDSDWKERQATQWADRLRRAFGGKLNDLPDVSAMALDLYNPTLGPQMIGIGAWAEETIAAAAVLKAEAEIEPEF